MDDTRFEVVGAFLTKIDADLAHGALEAAGIPSTVAADDAGGSRPSLWMSGVRLLVPCADAARARAILQAAEDES